ncbi:MAG: putative S-layer protein [Candidatus Pacearchaeota archaeon]|nr:putative S-layer protein [Candidatus Pacearchaeota archaeon]
MNSKTISIFSAFIFSFFILSLACAQADLLISDNSGPLTVYQNGDISGYLTLYNNGTGWVNNTMISASNLPSNTHINFNQNNISLASGANLTVDFNISADDSAQLGTKTVTINAGSTSFSFNLTVQEAYCSKGINKDHITHFDVDADNDFYVGDTINIDIDLETNDDVDIIVEAQLWDATDNEEIDSNDTDISLDDESDTVTLLIKIPTDINEDHDIQLRVKAYEYDNEDKECREYIDNLDITRESHKLIIDQINLNNENIQCGGDLSGYVKIVNVGNHKESDITVTVKNTALNLSLVKNIDSLDKTDTEKVTFTLTVPTTAKEGVYNLEVLVDYSEDTIKDYSSDFTVAGNCVVQKPDVAITVSQQGTGEVGQNGLSKITVINTGTTSTTYNISISDYQNWAELVNLAPQTVTLSPGEKADIYLTLRPNSNAGSVNTFYVQVVFGENVKTGMGSMQVNKKASAGTFFSDLWNAIVKNLALAIINLILIIAVIILLIVALTRRLRKKEESTEMRLKVKTNGNGNGKKKRK